MVETPTALLIESTTTEDKEEGLEKEDSLDKEPLLEQCEVTLVQQTPLTTSIRQTLKHLRSSGGFFARYRGIGLFSINILLLSQLSVIFSFIPLGLGSILSATALSTLRMAWTHVAISSPSPLPWFRRIPSIKTFRSIAPITALVALSEELAVGLPLVLAMALGLTKDIDAQACLLKVFAVAAVCFSWIILVVVPVTTVLSRIHASLLPEAEETIVTVQRDGVLSIKEAWKSVDWNARVRVYKMYLKGMMIQMSLMIMFSAVMYTELVLFLGPKFPEVMTQLMIMV
jgi:hypothetical protein